MAKIKKTTQIKQLKRKSVINLYGDAKIIQSNEAVLTPQIKDPIVKSQLITYLTITPASLAPWNCGECWSWVGTFQLFMLVINTPTLPADNSYLWVFGFIGSSFLSLLPLYKHSWIGPLFFKQT